MKRLIRSSLTVASLLVGLGLSACTDPTEEPSSTVTEGNVFKDARSYRAFLAKIYAGLAVSGQQGPAGNPDLVNLDEGFSQYLRLYWEHQELPTDEAIIAWGDQGLPEMNTQGWSAGNGFVSTMYSRAFYQVALANEFLRQTSDGKLSERGVSNALKADIQVFRAEARFLRALSYWHLLDLYGPVPVVTEPIVAPPKQNTRQEVYDFVVGELTAIQADLPAATGAGTYGRATKEAAAMLLAKVYLNAEVYTGTAHYGDVITALTPVLNGPFSLDPNYNHLFRADNNTSPEIIFPIIQDGIRTRTWGGMTFIVHASCGGSMANASYGIDGCWWGTRVRPEAYAKFGADPRGSFFYTAGQANNIASISNFTDGVAAPKFSNKTAAGADGSNSTHVDTDFPMFRLGDAYLMYAEAVVRGGGGSRPTALGYINALRQRAYGNATGNIVDATMTLPFILDERTRELLWEGHRRTDLVRFGLFTGNGYIWQWKGGLQPGSSTDGHLNLYPIPAGQLSANSNLQQNPGY
ncbi:MAG: RagB/SusD family nutrient uptake outer membrane protein [Gemmatimonadales bacterium]